MILKNKTISIILIICMLLVEIAIAWRGDQGIQNGIFADETETIYIWYTDESLTDYISSAALDFYDEKGIRVVPVLHSGLEYMEAINQASISGNEVPDLYIAGTDTIKKAAMAGLAVPVQDVNGMLTQINYPVTALDAVTYHEQKFAYPFYYETAFLLYNETYLEEIANSALQTEIAEAMQSEDEGTEDGAVEDIGMEDINENTASQNAIPEGYTEEEWNGMVADKVVELIPDSIGDILDIANNYNPPENVENIFLWDVSDIFYNYFFTGASMNLGGRYGDDASQIMIYNEETIASMNVYQQLHHFFSIESKESSYEDVINEFIEGKSIFTIATTDAIVTLNEAIAAGSFPYSYNVADLPDVDAEHAATGLSTTSAVMVNGYSENQKAANEFAQYLTNGCSNTLFERTGKLQTAYGTEDYATDVCDRITEIYKNTVSLPKIFEISNFWIQLELTYTQVWDGADANQMLLELSEQMKTQIAGEAVTEEVITLPAESEETDELEEE
ncbi:MAG TPA: extracellular solute-binding protein [Lachnospiraceae bacterium]|nr:extracellular solute-binding protein [Lachnospiraceae bacterium]